MRCFVPTCRNNSDKRRRQGVTFHKITKAVMQESLKAIGRRVEELGRDSRICSDHFNATDFFQGNRKLLKPYAIPTLNLSSDQKCNFIEPRSSPTTRRPSRRLNTSPAVEIDICEQTSLDRAITKQSSSSSGTSTSTSASIKRKRKYISLDHNYSLSPGNFNKQIKYQTEMVSVYRSKYKSAKRTSVRRKQKTNHLKDIVADLKNKHSLSTTALEHLEKSFVGIPQALMKRMLNNHRSGKITRAEYPPELKRFAMTLQFYNDKAYRYVRRVFDLALPAESTIRAWLSKVDCEPGFSKPSLDALRVKAETYYGTNKKTLLCSLLMDEMSIKKEVTVEPATLKTRGYIDTGCEIENPEELELAQEALVLMVVGVNDHFKVPIAYFFVNKLNGEEKANIVREALRQLHSTGAKILSVTFDGPHVHFKMMKELGCQIADLETVRPYFNHPVDGSNIFVFLDICHMLKLVRNNWEKLEKFKDPNGRIIDWNFIKELNRIQQLEGLVLANKLREKHIKFRKAIMKVNLAAQTISASVADALEFLYRDLNLPQFQGVEATVDFIRTIDGLFDLLNSRNPFGRGYKTPLKTQNEDYWKPFMETSIKYLTSCSRLDNKMLTETPSKTPFVGFVVSANSLMNIYDQEVKSGNLKYLLSYKFSQDHLELFFCSIRSRNGWVVNPSCLQFIQTYKRLLIHNEVRDSGGNCLAQDQTKILTITSTKKKVQETDIFMQRRRDEELDALDVLVEFNMPMLPTKLGEFAENVVAYIAGFVIRMIQKHNLCSKCVEALILGNEGDREDSSLKLIQRKSRGGLLWPSQDLRQICCSIEKKIQVIFEMYNQKLPSRDIFLKLLLREGIIYYSDGKLFKSLDEHVVDQSVLEVPHKRTLIDDIIKSYAKIRLHSLSKTINETLCESNSRKLLSRLIIFRNQ